MTVRRERDGRCEERLAEAARRLEAEGLSGADAAVILGSGLSSFAEGLEVTASVPYSEIPGFPLPRVEGHGGKFVVGTAGGRRVLVFAGRVHYYEGRSYDDVTFAVHLLPHLGVPILMVTNAAGGIDPEFSVGDVMLIADQISLVTGRRRAGAGVPFRMAGAYSNRLRRLLREAARHEGVALREGVYLGSLGPSYETPAEVRLARILGAHAVGMSTVVEVQAAVRAGLEVAGLSLITNVPLPGRFEKTTHSEVLAAGRAGGRVMLSLVSRALTRL